MLHAYLRKKMAAALRKVRDDERLHHLQLAGAVRASEDLLTSSIFGVLRYLPPEICWRLIVEPSHPIGGAKPERWTAITRFEFWPDHSVEDGETSTGVEPDVVLWTDRGPLVVEAKWKLKQTAAQLENEFRAVAGAGAQTTVLAMGGSSQSVAHLRDPSRDWTLLALTWRELLASTRAVLRSELVSEHRRALADIIAVLEDRGEREYRTFDSLPEVLAGRRLVEPPRKAPPVLERLTPVEPRPYGFALPQGLLRLDRDATCAHWRPA